MAEPQKLAKLSDNSATTSGVKANLALLTEAAGTFRRVKGDEAYDAQGVRTIWHQGRPRIEMLSWENKAGTILRQELSFFARVVDFRQGKPVNTGRVPHEEPTTDSGAPRGNVVTHDPRPSHETLRYASHLLKHVLERDFYSQHLLKQINDAINTEFDDTHTVVSGMDGYAKERPTSHADVATQVGVPATMILGPAKARTSIRVLAFALLVVAGLVLGVGIGLLLW
ncbi:MAG: hypothetical protein HY903_20890 [Deltaproteobacteria bacterium]|nr:hypothetical protein [Deltaproteobacteria bacterium]